MIKIITPIKIIIYLKFIAIIVSYLYLKIRYLIDSNVNYFNTKIYTLILHKLIY